MKILNISENKNIVNIKTDLIGKIPNIAVATFQHLRMSFGIDTVKPDQRVKEILEYEFKIKSIHTVSRICFFLSVAAGIIPKK